MAVHPAPRIFISYSRKDGADFARALRKELETHGFSLFQDIASLEGGEAWWNQIENALREVEYMVLVLTPQSLGSPIVEKEWRLARQLGVCVAPVFGCDPKTLDLQRLRLWMRDEHIYNLEIPEQKTRFLRQLESPCKVPRVPFLAGELPADFVPRSGEFNALRDALLGPRRERPVSITAALRGAGGYGKTTLARALCHDEDVQAEFHDGILWVELGETPRDLTAKIADLIEFLTGSRPGFEDVHVAGAKFAETLGDRDCLLVIDDVWDAAHARPFLQGGPRTVRLITTRNADTLPPESVNISVDQMQSAEAVELLGHGLPADEAAGGRLVDLAARLGEWPLLLKLVNRALLEETSEGAPLADALAFVNEALDEEGMTAFDAGSQEDRHRAVAATLGLSFKRLEEAERTRLRELSIFPEDTDIPLALVERLWRVTAGTTRVAARKFLKRLYAGSLVLNLDLEKRTVRLHDVIRTVLRSEAGADLARWVAAFLDAVRPESGHWWDLPSGERYLYTHLPWLLREAGRDEELAALFLEFRWLRAKLEATDINTLLADFLCAPAKDWMPLLEAALRLSSHVLAKEKWQIAGRLAGHLLGQERVQSAIGNLLVSATAHARRPLLRPKKPSLTPPGGPLVRTLVGHEGPVRAVAVTPDGRLLVSASLDETIKVWDFNTGLELRTLTLRDTLVNSAVVATDSRRVLLGCDDRTLRIWDLAVGAAPGTLARHTGWIIAVAIPPDSRIVVAGGSDGTVKTWDLETGAELHNLVGHAGWVNGVAVSPDGRFVVSGSRDQRVKIWDLEVGKETRSLAAHTDAVTAVAVTPDGRWVVSGSVDQTVKVSDLNTGRVIQTLAGHKDAVQALAVTGNGRYLVSGSTDQTVKVWHRFIGQEMRMLSGHTGPVSALAVTPDSKHVVSGSEDQTIKIWDLEGVRDMRTLAGHKGPVFAVALTSDGRFAVSGSRDRKIKVWDTEGGVGLRTLTGHVDSIHAVAVLPDARRVVSGSGDSTVRIWDVETGTDLFTLDDTHGDPVVALAITPDGRRVVFASRGRKVKVWDLESGPELRTLAGFNREIWGVAVTPDGRQVVSGSQDTTLWVLDLETGETLKRLTGHSEEVTAVAVASEGHRAVSGSWDRTIRVWDLETWAVQRMLTGHIGGVLAVAMTPDGRLIVSGSGDHTVKVWHLESGKCLATLTLDAPVTCCAVSPDGRTIVAGDSTGVVHFLEFLE